MLSRVADALYWLNAYIERAENIARFIHVNMHMMLDLFMDKGEVYWRPLILASGDEKVYLKKHGQYTEEKVIHFLTFDQTNPNSIISCITAARHNAKSIREIISSEMWEQINHLYYLVKDNSRKRKIENLHLFFKQVRMNSHLFSGISDSTMLHNEGRYFGNLGRMLERADKTARIVDVKCFMLLPNAETSDSPYDILQWGALLKSNSAFEMYKMEYKKLTSRKIIEFLIFNEEFPRSILHCIKSANESLARMKGEVVTIDNVKKQLDDIIAWMSHSNTEDIIASGLHDYIDDIQLKLISTAKEIHESLFYIDHSKTTQKFCINQ